MRADSKNESPSSEGSPAPKQDPLERRRLQNRLSQRNHRRKIRDRIAKLQERVIANELRAAAALKGWDQTCSPTNISACHHSPYYQEPELTFGLRDHSPPSTEPSSLFFPSYSFPQSYSTDLLAPSPDLLGDSSCYVESALGSTIPNQISSGMQVENDQDMEFFHNPWGTLRTESLMGDLGSLCQPNLYVATERSLPHILHALEISSSQSKIIVLVSSESLPSPQTGLESNSRSMNSRLTNPLSSVYQCQPQSAFSLLTPQIISRAWTTPGPYSPYALHKTSGLPDDSFSALHI
ncbi:hypothetical protein N7451_007897 [Penicillium sp. IBT 35674x]|nr:hypothetical protein N7451_007897 [Penicillium sp. IBT 35674x]